MLGLFGLELFRRLVDIFHRGGLAELVVNFIIVHIVFELENRRLKRGLDRIAWRSHFDNGHCFPWRV